MGLFRLLDMFRDKHPEPLPAPDAKLALGALLVRVAKSDKDYSVQEIGLIDRILAQHFGLKPIAAAKMRATCEKLHAAAPDSDSFAKLIRDGLARSDRMETLTDLWMVVLADGKQDAAEVAIVDAARIAMGLAEEDSSQARAEAMRNLA